MEWKMKQHPKANFPPSPEIIIRDIQHNVGYFAVNHYQQLGDADSGNGVVFGKLKPYGEVAIKPFPTITPAKHEKEMLEYAKNKGFDTLNPLEIAVDGTYVYMISTFIPGLHHYGQIKWSENVASRRLKRELVPAINVAGNFVGLLHKNGITHGDFQAKNCAVRDIGSPVVIDMESSEKELQGSELDRKANKDLATFGTSILKRGLLADRSLSYRLKFLKDELIDPAHERAGVNLSNPTKSKDVLYLINDLIKADSLIKHPASKKYLKKVA